MEIYHLSIEWKLQKKILNQKMWRKHHYKEKRTFLETSTRQFCYIVINFTLIPQLIQIMYFSSILETSSEVTSFVYIVSLIPTSRSHVFLSRTYICVHRDWSVLEKWSLVIQNNNISLVRKNKWNQYICWHGKFIIKDMHIMHIMYA